MGEESPLSERYSLLVGTHRDGAILEARSLRQSVSRVGPSEAALLGSQMAFFSLCPHMLFPLYMFVS